MSAIDTVKNKVQALIGQVTEKYGQATGDKTAQAQGRKGQLSGRSKQAGQKIKDIFK